MRDANPTPRRSGPGAFFRRLGALAVMAVFAYLAYHWVTVLFAKELAGVGRWLHRLFS